MKKRHELLIMSAFILFMGIGVGNTLLQGYETKNEKVNERIDEGKLELEISDDTVGKLPINQISQLIHSVKAKHREDNGKLWGRKIDTRIMFIDPETKMFIASEQDANESLTPVEDVYAGRLPEDTMFSNSTLEYGGKRWATVIYEDATDNAYNRALCFHEMFHNVQDTLKIGYDQDGNFLEYSNEHMDQMDARISLKLEWEALHQALNTEDKAKKKEAIKDALSFRNERREKYHSTQDENRFETQEGLAEYTGQKLAYETKEQQIDMLNEDLKRVTDESRVPSYVRSFAYHSGPLYGVLLDEVDSNWRKEVSGEVDLGELLREAYGIKEDNDTIEELQGRYHYKEIYTYEKQRKETMDKKIEYYKELFKDEIVSINLEGIAISFDPNTIWDLGESGQVYQQVNVESAFGSLEVSDVALLSQDWQTITVSAKELKQEGNKVVGKGWSMILNDGHELVKEGKGYHVK